MKGSAMNVILILSDTFRRDFLGIYGNSWIRTPHLDDFARKCMIFDHAYTASFPTVPARTDLFTGRFVFTYLDWQPLPRNEIVLSEIFSQAGYITQLIADTPHILKDGYHFDRGFTGWEWIRGQENDRWATAPLEVSFPCDPGKLRSPETTVKQYLRNVAFRKHEEDYFPARTVLTAIHWLEQNYHHRPFFLYIDTFDPHEPWDPPRWYVDLYDPGYQGEEVIYPRYSYTDFLSPPELNHCRALYAGEVSLVDRWVGELLNTIDLLNLWEDTLVIFTSDHGFYFGEHSLIGKAVFGPQGLERSPLYNEVIRIPLLFYAPGVIPGQRCSAFVQFPDLLPTLLDLCGMEKPASIQGETFAPLLYGEKSERRNFALSSWSLIHDTPLTRVVDGVERRVASPRPSTLTTEEWSFIYAGSGDYELYHLPTDPQQNHNVADRYPEVAQQLHLQYLEFLQRLGTNPRYLEARQSL